MEQGYLAQVQALIDQKWKENPEEMKRVMAEIKAKEKQKAKAKTQKRVSFDPQLTQELIEELNKKESDISKLQDLVERGADVNVKVMNKWTLLHEACLRNDLKLVKLLLDRGANVKAKNKWGWTPLHLACERKGLKLPKLLLDRGADVRAKTGDGSTPLHFASYSNALELAKLLIEEGADASATCFINGYEYKTPFDYAKSKEMKALLQKYMK